MVIKEDKQRLHRLLADALPLLCRSGLPRRPSFCIEALIGITLEDDEVMLISFKQQIHADQNPSKDDFFDSTPAAGKEAMTSQGGKTLYLPATKEKVDRTDDETGGKTTGRAFLGGKGGKRTTVPGGSSVLPVVKLEDVDVKMEDVEMNSGACGLHSELRDDFVTDSLSWNFHKYNTFPTAVSKTAETGNEECTGFVGRGSWKGDKRTANKIGRKKTGQMNNGSLSNEDHDDHTSPPDVGIKKEWHRKRKDGRAGVNPTASSNSASVSFAGDVQIDGHLPSGLSAEAQDSAVNQSIADIQLTDDKVTLEQTCKILSSYRLAGNDDNLYSCHICEAKLRGRQTLNEHIRGTHLCAHTYRCSTCGTSFKWRSGLQRHRSRCAAAPATLAAETNAKTDA